MGFWHLEIRSVHWNGKAQRDLDEAYTVLRWQALGHAYRHDWGRAVLFCKGESEYLGGMNSLYNHT